ncbi:ATP-binding protein [Methanosarcina sp. Kolksee]|uniref:ATP-binding protein n=1 Tax=Methanosarcina sp. Kolksee TaxID=1434099 RepID=UPI0035106AB3
MNKSSQYLLVVSDNGLGFPEGLDFRNTGSLGLQLANILVEQLEGTIELQKDSGTTFKILFRENN